MVECCFVVSSSQWLKFSPSVMWDPHVLRLHVSVDEARWWLWTWEMKSLSNWFLCVIKVRALNETWFLVLMVFLSTFFLLSNGGWIINFGPFFRTQFVEISINRKEKDWAESWIDLNLSYIRRAIVFSLLLK